MGGEDADNRPYERTVRQGGQQEEKNDSRPLTCAEIVEYVGKLADMVEEKPDGEGGIRLIGKVLKGIRPDVKCSQAEKDKLGDHCGELKEVMEEVEEKMEQFQEELESKRSCKELSRPSFLQSC